MHSRDEHPLRSYLSCTRFLLIIFFTCPVIFFAGGCSKEEPPEVKETKVVMPIKKPMPKPSGPPDQDKALEEKEKSRELKPPLQEEQPAPPADTGTEKGYYKVRKGDSLKKVAGLEDVYDDPMKWTSLFRLNMDKLEGMEATAIHEIELPEGLDLKFVTESEADENLTKLGQKVYAVNVLSAETTKNIAPQAIILMKNGYNAYICIAMVKGKEWLRLRAGFFKGYSEAVAAGEHITTILKGTNVWVARVNKSELKQFGGY